MEAVMTEDLHDDEAVFVMAAILVQTLAARKGKRQGVSVRVWYGLHCCIWFQESKSISASFKSLLSVKRGLGQGFSLIQSCIFLHKLGFHSEHLILMGTPESESGGSEARHSESGRSESVLSSIHHPPLIHPFITLPSSIRPSVRPSLDYLVILPP